MRGAAFAVLALLAGCMAAERQAPAPAVVETAPVTAPSGADAAVATAEPQPAAEDALTAGKAMPAADPTAPLDDALTCLARTVYWEAKGEGEQGMNAVAHVVLNRVSAQGYPDDVCGVVTDGGRIAPCQFSWYCDQRTNVAQEPDAYEEAYRVAWNALSGQSDDPTAGATMFHNPRVNPRWAKRAKRTAVIGNHAFYRLN